MATILVVDDLKANREVLVTVLRHGGHRLLEAVDGSDALASVQTERPDLIITDVLMPVMDGYEFVRQLRLDADTSRIPVIFCTAHYAEREARELALASGVSAVLTKPIEPAAALSVVAEVLSGKPPGKRAAPAPLSADFDREHLRLLTDKVSRQTEDLAGANARLRALINIGLELASERDSTRLLQSVCTAAQELFGATYVTLGLLDRADYRLIRVFTAGPATADWINAGDAPPGILATVCHERRTRRGVNLRGEPAAFDLPATHPEVRAYMAAPLASPGHVYGWLFLAANEGREFSAGDEELLKALSGQAGRIFENGHFFRVANNRAEELEREVAERLRVEAALRQERDSAQRYLDTAEVILLALDVEGRITLVNRYGCDVLGWRADELIGRSWIDTCLPKRIRGRLSQSFEDLKAGDVSMIENPIVTRAGEERLIEWRNTVQRDTSGAVTGTFSSGTDVTARTQAAEALRIADERMRFALQNADVGIWDMDYLTGVLRWSERLEAHYGWAPGTFPGTFDAFTDRIHPDDRAAAIDAIGTAVQTGLDFGTAHRAVWPDGTVRWLHGAGRILLDEAGQAVRGVGISLDETGRRTLEEQYQQAQKMEAVGRLAAGVAHDFNNLLTAILGYCELVLSDAPADDPSRHDVTEIQKAGLRAAGLTRQLLAFSRKQIIEPKVLNLNTIVADMQGMLIRLIGEDVHIVLRLSPALGPVVADRGQVEQIVLNLAVNARDAMLNGGTLTLSTSQVRFDPAYAKVHAVAPGAYVRLTITDTGTGIPPEVMSRLFEPFFTTKELGKGTGLGLATIYAITSHYGGTVDVETELGVGTSFQVHFPLADGEETEAAPAPAARPGSVSQTVLVVEDAEGLRELTMRLLQRQGYTVVVAANADEAKRRFEEHPSIDLVLTDVVMPGESGPDLMKELLAQKPGLRVVYMSGYTEDAIVHHGVIKPGIAFLHKPFSSATLGQKLREALDRPGDDQPVT